MMEKVTVQLQKEIQAHGGDIKMIEMRAPIAKDIRNLGFPYSMDEVGGMRFDAKVIANYIEKLGNIPPSSVDQMAPVDFQACMGVVISFFGESPKT